MSKVDRQARIKTLEGFKATATPERKAELDKEIEALKAADSGELAVDSIYQAKAGENDDLRSCLARADRIADKLKGADSARGPAGAGAAK
jgi:hypothetical protein